MGTKGKNTRVKKARFQPGDRVLMRHVGSLLPAVVVEDRGCLGIGGRRLYGLSYLLNPSELRYTERPEEELEPAPADEAQSPKFKPGDSILFLDWGEPARGIVRSEARQKGKWRFYQVEVITGQNAGSAPELPEPWLFLA
jgi:hypothetical protein